MTVDAGRAVVDGLLLVAEHLHEALGHGGFAVLEVHLGHDHQPFVYVRKLSDERGSPLTESPQHVLGVDGWLRLVGQLTDLVREEHPTCLRKVGDVHVLAF